MQYDVTSKKAFITEKSVGESLKYMGKVSRADLRAAVSVKKGAAGISHGGHAPSHTCVLE